MNERSGNPQKPHQVWLLRWPPLVAELDRQDRYHLEWVKHGITVNAIGPGPTETPGLLAADPRSQEELDQDLLANMPLRRRMQPEELIGAAVYLASPSAGATTGHLLLVDGGSTAR